MKIVRVKFCVAMLVMFCSVLQILAEGFVAGTLVKVSDGYVKIENLRIGDFVICHDSKNNITQRPIKYIAKRSVNAFIVMQIGEESIGIDCDQQLYDGKSNSWVTARLLSPYQVQTIAEPIDMYLISVEEYHNFYVSKSDICAHNFFPIVAGISFLFGSGAIEFAGISIGLAALGTYIGCQWHKNNQDNIAIGCIPVGDWQNGDGLYNANAKAPGVPTENDGFIPKKNWDGKKVRNPNGPSYGWPDEKGRVWVPSGPNGHGAPHWDVELPDGTHINIMPGGHVRGQR